jgi:hypothetical protein
MFEGENIGAKKTHIFAHTTDFDYVTIRKSIVAR